MRPAASVTTLLVGFASLLLNATGVCADDAPSASSAGKGVHESVYVRIGGIDQWVQIRGDDRENPVLLWLNGGPGGSTMLDTPVFRSWERKLTVVMWDERGEGKTFEKNGESEASSMTFARLADDGIELTEWLRKRLYKDKIILLGHSAGSIVGTRMIRKRPDLFAVYVGTGQVIHLPLQLEAAYPQLRARAQPGSEAERELTALGPPPWKNDEAYEVVNKWGAKFEPPFAPPTDEDRRLAAQWGPRPPPPAYIEAGRRFSDRTLSDQFVKEDLRASGNRFQVPIVLIQGSEDLITTTSAVQAFFDTIVAPSKEFVVLPGAGHNGIFRQRDAFFAQLLTHAAPFAAKRPQPGGR
jgi:pimeloyl-ACP methyl ester carboxylesterase